MTLPSVSAALGAPTTAPMPALVDGLPAEGLGVAADGAVGGFAAALDEATMGLDAPISADGVIPSFGTEVPVPSLAVPAVMAAVPLVSAPLPAIDAGAGSAISGDAALDAAAPTPGWPPPGLSSLFPAAPMLAAQAGAAVAGSTLPSVRGFALTALGLDASADGTADLTSATTTRLTTATTATSLAAAASPTPATTPIAPDALAAALVRQPAPLRALVADDSDASALTALADTLGADRAPDLAPTSLAAPAPALHKLDLAQAFPAPVPLPSPRFAEEVGARLQWIAEQQGGEATLRISPEGLGPVEIRMKLDGDRVDLGFLATQQDTRQALQDALPKLREMLAQQGLQLGQADVGQKHAQSSNDDARRSAGGVMNDEGTDAVARAPEPQVVTRRLDRGGRGMLDLYA